MKTTLKFTKAKLNPLQPAEKGKRNYYHDEKTPGLILQVTDSGTKTFQVYKWQNNKPVRVTLGRYPGMTIEQAQKIAKKTIAELADGIDPNKKKKADRVKGVTLRECFDKYIKTKKLKPGTIIDYERVMREGFSDWQNKPMKEITRDMVEAKHRNLGKNSEARANNAMRVLRALFNYAGEVYEDEEGRTLFPDNPVKRLSKTNGWYTIERKQTVIKDHELEKWFEAVLSLSLADGVLYDTARDYLLVLMLTGMRKTECAKLSWENICFKSKTLKIIDVKNNKAHTLPLSDYLQEILQNRYNRRTHKKFVFPSDTSSTGYISDVRGLVKIVRQHSGVVFTLHDIRRTFITIAEGRDISVYALKRLVNHSTKNGDVTDGYIITDVERLRGPMQQVTDYILKAAGVKKTATVTDISKVVK